MSEEKEKVKKLPKGSVKLKFAGDLILAKCSEEGVGGYFRRFETFFETLANLGRDDRIIKYKMINALMLTSHAKKENDVEQKKHLFDLKNKLFLDIVSNPEQRRKIALKYLTANRPRVVKYCDDCTKVNTDAGTNKFRWKYCKKCQTDATFFNVVSMFHKFDGGSFSLFISQDMIDQLPVKHFKNTGKLVDYKEEAVLGQLQYGVKNLDAVDIDSVLKMYDLVHGK